MISGATGSVFGTHASRDPSAPWHGFRNGTRGTQRPESKNAPVTLLQSQGEPVNLIRPDGFHVKRTNGSGGEIGVALRYNPPP
jgi:hypothetical protein